MKALVVDDAPMVRTRVAALLREVAADIEVVEAGDADEAFESIRSGSPDLVVLDIHLPGLNGLQMLPTLTRRANPPVVIVPPSTTRPSSGTSAVFFSAGIRSGPTL